jgi:hypothetical protein
MNFLDLWSFIGGAASVIGVLLAVLALGWLSKARKWWLTRRFPRSLIEKDPQDTFIILSATLQSNRLQGNHPAWEIYFLAYNGGFCDVRLESASGTFKVGGQGYPSPAELKEGATAKYGEMAPFAVRQWIDQEDVPQMQQGQNHVVLQLSDLKIEAIAVDPVLGSEQRFVVPLPEHFQFDTRNHWNISPEPFSRFYWERLGCSR